MSPLLTWEGTGDVPNFCPEGCGGLTEDPYGGPCQACWDKIGKTASPEDGQDCQAAHCPPSAAQDCEPDGLMTPLAAVAVVKGLSADGKIIYCRLQTSDITVIEAIGMHEAAAAMHKASLPGVR